MLIGREGLDVILDLKLLAPLDRPLGCGFERPEVDVAPQPEEDSRVLATDHHVVALVLGVRPAEDTGHVVVARVAMDREIATLDGVEVIEPDRERRLGRLHQWTIQYFLG